MKKAILLLTVFSISTFNVKAQKSDTARAIVHYKFSHLRDTTNRDKPYTENMILFVGAASSAYKSYDRKIQEALMKKQVADQIAEQKGNGGPINIKVTGRGESTRNEFYQFPLQSKLVRKERLITAYLIEEPMPAINWKISNDTASFAGLHCQKATGHFKGRDYTAWFCADLPFHTGPWKLNGLPGLIVEAYDARKEVVFKFDGMEEVSNTPKTAAGVPAPTGGLAVKMIGMEDDADPNIIALPADAVKTTGKEFKRLEEAMRKDPNAFAKSAMAGSGANLRPANSPAPGSGPGQANQVNIQVNGNGPVINNPIELPEKK
jgi:GLPGLI family protein